MTTLTLIGEPFPDWETSVQRAAIEDLTQAIADTAPRACGARLLIARGRDEPEFHSPNITTETMPLAPGMLPVVWQTGPTARPLDGEFVHALTPMVPLRGRSSDDGTQTSVTVTHTLAWEAPTLMGANSARLYRSFVRRAIRHADVIVTPSYAVASVLQRRYGSAAQVQVLPLATPSPLLEPGDADELRQTLGLPDRYNVTIAAPTEVGRLSWILDAMLRDPDIPPLVILDGLDSSSVHEDAATSRKNNASSRGAKAGGAAAGSRARTDRAPTDSDALADEGAQSDAGPQSGTAAQADSASATLRPETVLQAAIPAELRNRVSLGKPRNLADVATIISGAELMLQPQQIADSGYYLHAALTAGVPILHAECDATHELVLDAGVSVADEQAFAFELSALARDDARRRSLSVLADDRSRSFSWRSTAWQLWELHANL